VWIAPTQLPMLLVCFGDGNQVGMDRTARFGLGSGLSSVLPDQLRLLPCSTRCLTCGWPLPLQAVRDAADGAARAIMGQLSGACGAEVYLSFFGTAV